MSTSKGRGAAAHQIVDALPPEPMRLLFLRPRPNQAIEFDPEGTDAIPRLFDELDRLAAATAGREVKGELPPDPERIFALTEIDPAIDHLASAAAFRPAFSHLALLAQIPGVDIAARAAAEKGDALTEHETTLLDERLRAARAWLEAYAPEDARIAVRMDGLPEQASGLPAEQRAFCAALADAAASGTPADGEAWQTLLFRIASEAGLGAGAAFRAVYLAFLGRTNGPRAGWLLAGLDGGFVVGRLRSAALSGPGMSAGAPGTTPAVSGEDS
jgi:lysyl-tRNA synthetase class 1